MPPAITVSTASFTVPPSAVFARRNSPNGNSAHPKRRSGESGAFHGARGAGRSRLGAEVPTAPASCRRRASSSVGRNRRKTSSVAAWATSVSRSRTASCSRVSGSGSGRGCQGEAGGTGGAASGLRSWSTMVRSTPETPSIMA